jgi:hypothetical protein
MLDCSSRFKEKEKLIQEKVEMGGRRKEKKKKKANKYTPH